MKKNGKIFHGFGKNCKKNGKIGINTRKSLIFRENYCPQERK